MNTQTPTYVLFASAAKHTFEEALREDARARAAWAYWQADAHRARAKRLRDAARDHLEAARVEKRRVFA